jgi:hypothetical protein
MKPIRDNDTIQIEITNQCPNLCGNCTRFVGLTHPFTLDFNQFKGAVDSLVDFPNMIGLMGGEPLLHPEFARFCEYALSKIPRERLGLWSCFPKKFVYHREIIAKTFGNIFLNDHTRIDVYHHPFLVAACDVLPDSDEIFYRADSCFFQCAWSPSINHRGAYFCEIAASLAALDPLTSRGWKVKDGWWKRTPKDYKAQIEEFCPRCGGMLFLKRRASVDQVYDISKSNLLKMKRLGISDSRFKQFDQVEIPQDQQENLAAYKDPLYRDQIAARYGMFLTVNEKGFNEPHLLSDFSEDSDSILAKYRRRYM